MEKLDRHQHDKSGDCAAVAGLKRPGQIVLFRLRERIP